MDKILLKPEKYKEHNILCEKGFARDGKSYMIYCFISHPDITPAYRKKGEPYFVTYADTKEEAIAMAKKKVDETITYLANKPKRRTTRQKLQDMM